jgi:hypothetical protein
MEQLQAAMRKAAKQGGGSGQSHFLQKNGPGYVSKRILLHVHALTWENVAFRPKDIRQLYQDRDTADAFAAGIRPGIALHLPEYDNSDLLEAYYLDQKLGVQFVKRNSEAFRKHLRQDGMNAKYGDTLAALAAVEARRHAGLEKSALASHRSGAAASFEVLAETQAALDGGGESVHSVAGADDLLASDRDIESDLLEASADPPRYPRVDDFLETSLAGVAAAKEWLKQDRENRLYNLTVGELMFRDRLEHFEDLFAKHIETLLPPLAAEKFHPFVSRFFLGRLMVSSGMGLMVDSLHPTGSLPTPETARKRPKKQPREGGGTRDALAGMFRESINALYPYRGSLNSWFPIVESLLAVASSGEDITPEARSQWTMLTFATEHHPTDAIGHAFNEGRLDLQQFAALTGLAARIQSE